MKNLLILLLVLPLYAQQPPIINQFIRYNTPPHNLPYIMPAEIYKLRTPVPDMDVNNRLVRVQDNFAWRMSMFFLYGNPFKEAHLPPIFREKNNYPTHEFGPLMKRYFEIYVDPVTMDYYQGPFFELSERDQRRLKVPPLAPREFTNRNRMVYLINLEPSVRVYADAADGNKLWGQKLTKLPDLYKGWFSWKYLYIDPENKYRVTVKPLTNRQGFVCYEGVHPITGETFYGARYDQYDGDLAEELSEEQSDYPTGILSGFSDTPNEMWQYQKQLLEPVPE